MDYTELSHLSPVFQHSHFDATPSQQFSNHNKSKLPRPQRFFLSVLFYWNHVGHEDRAHRRADTSQYHSLFHLPLPQFLAVSNDDDFLITITEGTKANKDYLRGGTPTQRKDDRCTYTFGESPTTGRRGKVRQAVAHGMAALALLHTDIHRRLTRDDGPGAPVCWQDAPGRSKEAFDEGTGLSDGGGEDGAGASKGEEKEASCENEASELMELVRTLATAYLSVGQEFEATGDVWSALSLFQRGHELGRPVLLKEREDELLRALEDSEGEMKRRVWMVEKDEDLLEGDCGGNSRSPLSSPSNNRRLSLPLSPVSKFAETSCGFFDRKAAALQELAPPAPVLSPGRPKTEGPGSDAQSGPAAGGGGAWSSSKHQQRGRTHLVPLPLSPGEGMRRRDGGSSPASTSAPVLLPLPVALPPYESPMHGGGGRASSDLPSAPKFLSQLPDLRNFANDASLWHRVWAEREREVDRMKRAEAEKLELERQREIERERRAKEEAELEERRREEERRQAESEKEEREKLEMEREKERNRKSMEGTEEDQTAEKGGTEAKDTQGQHPDLDAAAELIQRRWREHKEDIRAEAEEIARQQIESLAFQMTEAALTGAISDWLSEQENEKESIGDGERAYASALADKEKPEEKSLSSSADMHLWGLGSSPSSDPRAFAEEDKGKQKDSLEHLDNGGGREGEHLEKPSNKPGNEKEEEKEADGPLADWFGLPPDDDAKGEQEDEEGKIHNEGKETHDVKGHAKENEKAEDEGSPQPANEAEGPPFSNQPGLDPNQTLNPPISPAPSQELQTPIETQTEEERGKTEQTEETEQRSEDNSSDNEERSSRPDSASAGTTEKGKNDEKPPQPSALLPPMPPNRDAHGLYPSPSSPTASPRSPYSSPREMKPIERDPFTPPLLPPSQGSPRCVHQCRKFGTPACATAASREPSPLSPPVTPRRALRTNTAGGQTDVGGGGATLTPVFSQRSFARGEGETTPRPRTPIHDHAPPSLPIPPPPNFLPPTFKPPSFGREKPAESTSFSAVNLQKEWRPIQFRFSGEDRERDSPSRPGVSYGNGNGNSPRSKSGHWLDQPTLTQKQRLKEAAALSQSTRRLSSLPEGVHEHFDRNAILAPLRKREEIIQVGASLSLLNPANPSNQHTNRMTSPRRVR
uniref:Uncharacterized protein n=1 Tax=Chromera velia CCMP2878 TaxID=1169474 RepID=A0A0G4FA51_9ALVE|eukprot:Cvel_3015.t1-p1 / transcript=Cvel_3015.t1 / gene=Cvel_3015 / organism=Chromera_velia_CCMP2878 / gene_product=hypothetical protein / transcript_product=hypothetical protein / location=Cvel_scaffold120:40345-48772(-) / protein_length=1152 / sequence_SO=supercontig / SO=protein_coding / is_pseudo=false